MFHSKIHDATEINISYILDKQSAAEFDLPGLYLKVTENSDKANAQCISLALLGADSVRYSKGLWSKWTTTQTQIRTDIRAGTSELLQFQNSITHTFSS